MIRSVQLRVYVRIDSTISWFSHNSRPWIILDQCFNLMVLFQVLHVIYPEVLKRMNDTSNEVRILTAKTILVFFQSLPDNYDKDFYKAHLEGITWTWSVQYYWSLASQESVGWVWFINDVQAWRFPVSPGIHLVDKIVGRRSFNHPSFLHLNHSDF